MFCVLCFYLHVFLRRSAGKVKPKQYKACITAKTYASLVEDNNAKSSEIEGSVDYERIYDYAVNELGMMYPEKGQTVTYKRNPGSYVKQGEEIPSN